MLRLELLTAAGEPSRALRQLFDRDHNGLLDEAEQRALAGLLARTARLQTHLAVDGAELPLELVGPPALEGGGQETSSTGLLAVRLELRAAWPPGSGDWLGRRTLLFADEAAGDDGHVPVSASCTGCSISSSSDGVYQRDEQGVEHVVGASASRGQPLQLRVRIGRSGLSCGR